VETKKWEKNWTFIGNNPAVRCVGISVKFGPKKLVREKNVLGVIILSMIDPTFWLLIPCPHLAFGAPDLEAQKKLFYVDWSTELL
jgi:hypothetical protein